jgi:hypothetical protein
MKTLPATVLSISIVAVLPSCAKRNPPVSEAAVAFDRTIAAQDRVNRYFHADVEPRLMTCWAGITGRGTIAIGMPYQRRGDRWLPGTARISGSTVTDQDVALRCFQEAVRNTSFPVEAVDEEATEFEVNWSFPLPRPKDVTEVARMISTGGGGGGCGGGPEAPAPACFDCGYIPFLSFSYCKKVCSGYTNCTSEINGCRMGPITPKCVTASPFGNMGGIVKY